jgi:23S rRNA (adenine2503-C2)-methyltransferase
MDLSTIEITASSSSSSERIIQLQPWTRSQIQDHMPAARRHNSGLGHATLELLTSHTSNLPETVARLKHITTSHDGTTKLLLQLGPHHVDNNNNNSTTSTTMIETVIIPWPERQSSTLCVSSQVGCRQACTFCATGRIMGRGRNLTADEILAQVYWAQKVTRLLGNTSNNNHHDDEYGSTLSSSSVSSLLLLYPIDNVVFMGMGEPADNAPHVMRAVQVLLDPMQFQLTPRKVTISTVAPTPQAFAWLSSGSSRDDALAVSLAWSIHSSRDDIRKRLVPTTRYSMVELRQGLIQTLQGRPKKFRSILLSVTLLHQINDHQEDAMHLIQFCQAIFQQVPNVKLVVNVIPWNPFEPSLGDNVVSTFTSRPLDLAPPTWERILAFQNILMQHHIMCYIRTIRGDDTNSACGQLATAVATRKQS